MKLPKIKTSLPGPKAASLINIDRDRVSPSYTRGYPLVAERAKGLWIDDPDGNSFLDFTAGIAVCATGHCHPKVVSAIKKQADKLIHMSGTDFYYTSQIALAATWRNDVVLNAFEKGLLLLGCGENTIRFSPALTVSKEEIDVCLSIFEEVLLEVTS